MDADAVPMPPEYDAPRRRLRGLPGSYVFLYRSIALPDSVVIPPRTARQARGSFFLSLRFRLCDHAVERDVDVDVFQIMYVGSAHFDT